MKILLIFIIGLFLCYGMVALTLFFITRMLSKFKNMIMENIYDENSENTHIANENKKVVMEYIKDNKINSATFKLNDLSSETLSALANVMNIINKTKIVLKHEKQNTKFEAIEFNKKFEFIINEFHKNLEKMFYEQYNNKQFKNYTNAISAHLTKINNEMRLLQNQRNDEEIQKSIEILDSVLDNKK